MSISSAKSWLAIYVGVLLSVTRITKLNEPIAVGVPLSTPAGLRSCLTSLGYPTVTPLLVDLATFNGKPVAVLVLPGDATGRQIWVVSRGCSTAGDGMAYYGLLH